MKTLKLVGVLALFVAFLSSCGEGADSAVQDAANKVEAEVEKQSDAKGFIFDGFPRTTAQAEALDKYLNARNTPISMMLSLVVQEDELKTRLMERAKTSGRTDDADPKIIENRIATYRRETAPVADFYGDQNKLHTIDGVGSIDSITERLYAVIG